jgi:hypothetical protein
VEVRRRGRTAVRLRAALGAALLTAGVSASACVEGDVRGEAVTLERRVEIRSSAERASLPIHGAGWFRALTVEKVGGTTDRTEVSIELDGEPLLSTSFATLKNPWNQIATTYLVARVTSDGPRSILTIWYSPELKFRALANLRVDVLEDGVESLRVSAVMNKPAPHEHLPGQPGNVAAALPAFK